ncbi:Mitochondrial acidic protein mam33 [Steccherinum ochraceum]|uniref:Mitochondrial acidic protein mam33 n=1 Tax=Steccherinum ochraceum TaxID=92696 RepID=A0A4R0RE95_9APHY|nr:Mitochondrial acidic protein mam33 [Steccherinum ochraceum]
MSAIRALRQLTASSGRSWASRSVAASASRAWRPATATAVRTFSVSARRFGEGATDVSLAQKLAEELKYEKEAAPAETPEFLNNFRAQGVWEIDDIAGNDEVTIHRKFGNESIRLMFSIANIQEEFQGEEEESEEQPSYPIRCSFSFTKAGADGALTVDAMCQDGAFVVDNISFYGDAKIGTELTAEADWKRRGLYIGPQFETLDVSVQEEFEKFLQERGINESLALFVPDYAEHKEQKEYVTWLGKVKSFIEA